MKILALDTTHGICTVAITEDNICLAEKSEETASRQAEQLFPLIEEALLEANLGYIDLDAIAVTIGPGSFTGVRIGLAAARGIHLASQIPIIPVTSLEAIAYQASLENKTDLLITLDARRNEIFAQSFTANLTPISEPSLLAYSDITKIPHNDNTTLAGNGTPHIKTTLPNNKTTLETALPNARYIGFYANKKGQTTLPATPLYIRPPDAIRS